MVDGKINKLKLAYLIIKVSIYAFAIMADTYRDLKGANNVESE